MIIWKTYPKNGTSVTSVSDNLFIIDKSSPLLNEKLSYYFLQVTTRFLFAKKTSQVRYPNYQLVHVGAAIKLNIILFLHNN